MIEKLCKIGIWLLMVFVCSTGYGQRKVAPVVQDTMLRQLIPRDSAGIDTLNITPAQIPDSLRPIPANYKLSKDAISQEIDYAAQDSNITVIPAKTITLYNKANATYDKTKIEANIIVINFEDKSAKSFAKISSQGLLLEKGKFDDGTTNGSFEEMAYNFETNKAFARNLKKLEGEFTIIAEKSKFVPAEADTVYHEAKFFNMGTTFSSCNLDHPHFAIKTTKAKMIPEKYAVLGPAQLQIAELPTPLVLPFGFLPLIKGQSSGLIFPNDYEYNDNYGFGLREIGYYFPINDYMDLKVTGDIYTRGSHGIRTLSNYKKRYAYSGNVNLQYSNFIQENSEGRRESQISFSIGVNHNQDAKAHPYRKIGGNINISTNRHNQRNYFDAQSALTSQYRSSFSYNYNFPNSPFKLSAGLSHSQNIAQRQVNISFPDANLTMQTIQPFKRKNAVGEPAWYENINLQYAASMKNSVSTTDTTLFTNKTLEDLVSGLNHSGTLSLNSRILRYFTLTPSVTYRETYNLKSIERTFDNTLLFDTTVLDADNEIIEVDTTFGSISEKLVVSPSAFRAFNSSLSLNTQLFATRRFAKSKLRGIRHIMKPSVSFNYAPGTRQRYEKFVDTDTREEFNMPQSYNPFPNQPFGASLADQNLGLSFSINNTLEAKYYSRKDSTEKNLKLLENWTLNGSFDFERDSFNWTDITLRGNSRLIKGISTMNLTLNMTPYELNGTRLVNKLLWDEKRRPLQIRNLQVTFNSGLTIKEIIDKIAGKDSPQAGVPAGTSGNGSGATLRPPGTGGTSTMAPITEELPTLSSLIENFRLSHNLVINYQPTITGGDTIIINTHTIAANGNLKLTKNWSINLGHIGYDINNKAFTYPSFTFQRDLHCWTMNFGWFPQSDVYTFYIGAKSTTLSFLKYDYGQNRFGPGGFGR